ncbi:hypothetical protein SAMN05421765_1592 [Kaistella antarctica]|uniref:Uncharacterized protein n=1 Tax=Kaistella antarctica TaxID=266748 RepID=A0A3S4WPE7_9FLAO|nr:hypothetical protein HY04_00910 [Kaistella antarctica]SEV97265.1 hypothetical protein SAMN05421765_1592 [Kaistella antarctica]VEH96400.1 Uncharacterised protein [Kaistella antarctica]
MLPHKLKLKFCVFCPFKGFLLQLSYEIAEMLRLSIKEMIPQCCFIISAPSSTISAASNAISDTSNIISTFNFYAD